MSTGLSFNDITLIPADFTTINSRADVDTSSKIGDIVLNLPIIASNMDSVYSPRLAAEMANNGAIASVHRFTSIEENVVLFKEGVVNNSERGLIKPWVSVGLGVNEIERAEALVNAGAEVIIIDVANGAQQQVVNQFKTLKSLFNVDFIIGTFDNSRQINTFVEKSGKIPLAFLSCIGPGSPCVTRTVAGVGTPSVSCIIDCVKTGYNIIQNGGIVSPGDLAKALALGCKGVMMGRNLAATHESGAKQDILRGHKIYRGSASASSYETQNKTASFRAPEGEEFEVKVTGSVKDVLQYFEGGLRSSMTYLNAKNLLEFKENCKYMVVSNSSTIESRAHGRNK